MSGGRGLSVPVHLRDAKLRLFLEALRENQEILRGKLGLTDDRALTVRDLRVLGIIGVDSAGRLFDPNAPAAQSYASEHPEQYVIVTNDSGDPVTTNLGAAVQLVRGG